MAPLGANGEAGPVSIRKPTSLLVLFQVTVVPAFTQNVPLLLALGMLEVVDAPSDVRFTSTIQGEEADPHVFAALHSCSGLASEQAYLLNDWASANPANSGSITMSDVNPLRTPLWDFTKPSQKLPVHSSGCDQRVPNASLAINPFRNGV
jgi:hypothetical protein